MLIQELQKLVCRLRLESNEISSLKEKNYKAVKRYVTCMVPCSTWKSRQVRRSCILAIERTLTNPPTLRRIRIDAQSLTGIDAVMLLGSACHACESYDYSHRKGKASRVTHSTTHSTTVRGYIITYAVGSSIESLE